MSELVVYPDAHPENKSVDGYASHFVSGGDTWGNIRGGAGNISRDSLTTFDVGISSHSDINKWKNLSRAILLFDTSALPDGATIILAILSVYGNTKSDALGIAPDLNVYSSAPASDTALADGDYNSLDTIPFCDTAITYAGFDADGWNSFILNAAGSAVISKTGITKLGLRNANYDVANDVPAWSPSQDGLFIIWSADGDSDKRPKLTIAYTLSNLADQTIVGNKVSLEAIRNLEFVYGGRFYIGKSGKAVYESRYHRNV